MTVYVCQNQQIIPLKVPIRVTWWPSRLRFWSLAQKLLHATGMQKKTPQVPIVYKSHLHKIPFKNMYIDIYHINNLNLKNTLKLINNYEHFLIQVFHISSSLWLKQISKFSSNK